MWIDPSQIPDVQKEQNGSTRSVVQNLREILSRSDDKVTDEIELDPEIEKEKENRNGD